MTDIEASLGPADPLPPSLGPTWWPLRYLASFRTRPGMRRVGLVWLAVVAVSVATGVLNVALGWNGTEVRVLGVPINLTVYPPLVLSVVTAVWLGPTWGCIPVYLANVASALWSGIDWPIALLFALAGAIETAILFGSMVILEIDPSLRVRGAAWRFLGVSLIAAIVSSLGIVVWNAALGLDLAAGQRLWRGWVIGDFLQLALVVAPVLRLSGPRARAWIDRQFDRPPHGEPKVRARTAFALVVLGTIAAVVLTGIALMEQSLDVDPETRTRSGELLQPRLREIQFFLLLLVTAVFVATGIFANRLGRNAERQHVLARRDALTGCFNRRAFYELFQREADRSRRLGEGISLVFLDLDHFKVVNDRLGHEAGDRLLHQFARRLQGVVRETDLIVRWGGEEFVVILPHTGLEHAAALSERIRAAIEERAFATDGSVPSIRMSVSVGMAGTRELPADPDALLNAADAACYRAKQGGRNQVAAASLAV